jgi:hypothetical protein
MSITPPVRSELPDPTVVLLVIAIGVQALGMIWNSATRRAFKAAVRTVVTTMSESSGEASVWDPLTTSTASSEAAKAGAYWLALMAKFPD